MDIILLPNVRQHVLATYVTIFRGVRTKIQIILIIQLSLTFNCAVI